MFGFGGKKQLEAIQNGFKDVNQTLASGFAHLEGKLEGLMSGNELEEPGTSGNEVETPGAPSPSSVYQQSLSKLDQELLATSDPVKIKELLLAKKMIRGYATREEISKRAAAERRLELIDPHREPRERYDNNGYEQGPPSEEDVERIAQEVGVGRNGNFDPAKLHSSLVGLVNNKTYGGLAVKLAKQFGIDDLPGAIAMLGEVVKDPTKTHDLAAAVGSGLAGVVKEKLSPFITPRPQQQGAPTLPATVAPGQQPGQRPRAADGTPLFFVRGQWVDPRLPYQVPS